MSYWGYHLMLDCSGCDCQLINNETNIKNFVKDLVDRIQMRAFGEPTVQYFAEFDPDKAGYSLVQLIETSSITGHFVPHYGHAYIDIFSCKTFDMVQCQQAVQQYFGATDIKVNFLTRQA